MEEEHLLENDIDLEDFKELTREQMIEVLKGQHKVIRTVNFTLQTAEKIIDNSNEFIDGYIKLNRKFRRWSLVATFAMWISGIFLGAAFSVYIKYYIYYLII